MNQPILYTWRDVERLLDLRAAPPWLSVMVGPDEVEVACELGSEAAVQRVLREEFGTRFTADVIRLESLPGQSRILRVQIVPTSDRASARSRRVVRPLWLDAHLPEVGIPSESGDVRVAAFYSYKGGVGRSTCLLATAGALLASDKPARVLLVDADVEAPGLTWNIPGPPDRISLMDALGLIHDEDDWLGQAIPLIADRVAQNQEIVELPSGRASFYFLPAFRDFDQVFSLPLTFEQIVRARGRAYTLGDALIALGKALNIDVVLVDLRAGITDFSSPLLLDGRIQSILVTSCSRQSVEGTVQTLKRMRQRIKAPTSPEVVLSLIPPGEPEGLLAGITEEILSALPPSADEVEIALDRGIHNVSFAQELLHFESIEDLLARRIPGTDLGKRVAGRLANLLMPDRQIPAPGPVLAPTDMESVITLAKKLEYAETSGVRDLLPTAALTALVEHFSSSLPAAVVLGSKGAGKTFAWIQMVAARRWAAFRELVLQAPSRAVDALVFPLLAPVNLDASSNTLVKDVEHEVWQALGSAEDRLSMEGLQDRLERLGNASQDSGGLDESAFWTGAIAGRLGLAREAGASVGALATALERTGKSVVLAADGFEDAFQLAPERPLHEAQRRILRALFQRVVPQVRDLASPVLGVVTLVRRDLAEESIPQNFGQFESLYSKFSLVWSPTEALRLAAWLLDRASRPVLSREEIPTASYEELTVALQSFWGARMGSEKAKEAHTDRWVIAALSDLQGRLQPRDIVRLIRVAAEKDRHATRLAPQSLRGALAACSAEKIREIEQEIRALKPIFDKLRKAPDDKKAIPFLAEDFALTDDEVGFLKRQGIVTSLGEGTELFMPEIIRQGLGFRLKEGRRAKVLALYRAALKSFAA